MSEENQNKPLVPDTQYVVARQVGAGKPIIPQKPVGPNEPPTFVPWSPNSKFEPIADCKLCQSRYKEEAEELYDRTMNIKRVHKLLTEDRHEDISYNAVRNHLKYHYQARSDRHLMIECANEVTEWVAMQDDQKAGLVRTMAFLERENAKLSALAEGLPLPEYRKTIETAGKVKALLLQYRKAVQEIERENEGVTLVFQQIKVILGDTMKEVKTADAQKVVSHILLKMKDQFGHIDIEE